MVFIFMCEKAEHLPSISGFLYPWNHKPHPIAFYLSINQYVASFLKKYFLMQITGWQLKIYLVAHKASI